MIVGDPSPVAWGRIWRYASWMRRVDVEEWTILGGDTLLKLRLNSPPSGGWFPALRILIWSMVENSLPYADLFFSPHLEDISLFTPFYHGTYWGFPWVFCQLLPRSSRLCRHQISGSWRCTGRPRYPGNFSRIHWPLSCCVADRRLLNLTPRSLCRTRQQTI